MRPLSPNSPRNPLGKSIPSMLALALGLASVLPSLAADTVASNGQRNFTITPQATPSVNGTPTITDRLACRTALANVAWQARIWPASNPGAKPALADVVSAAGIAAEVEQSLARSVALERFWEAPITGEMLQAELDRMAAASRRPTHLAAMFAALGNDPALAAECLARPILAERLVRERFVADPRFTGEELDSWWATAQPATGDFAAPNFAYRLPAVNPVTLGSDLWQDTAAVPLDTIGGDVEGWAVWTGSEMVFGRDFSREAYRYDPATQNWQTTPTLDGPLGLRDTTAVWTGRYVIASNGCTANNARCTTSLAWRYDPLADTWERIPDAPISRTDQSAVWTGSEMFVWGGCAYANDLCNVYPQTGALYDPESNSWRTTSTIDAPPGRTFPNLVWTGTEVVVWGGEDGAPATGGRYDPVSDTWQPVSVSGAPIADSSTAVWTGQRMIAWGGCAGGTPACTAPLASGGQYDPATDTWTPTSAIDAPAARFGHAAVWTGDAMLVWGGDDGVGVHGDGALYDPASDTWSAVSTLDAPAPRSTHRMLWTGTEALVWGGSGEADMRSGARYDPLADAWTPVETSDPDSFRRGHAAVWTGAEMLVWGGIGDGGATAGLDTGRRYDPATDSWSSLATAGAPAGAFDATAVWTGTEMIVFGGQSGTLMRDGGGRYNPTTDSWATLPTDQERIQHAAIWTGEEMVVWGGWTPIDLWSNTGARYDPATNAWSPTATAGAPSPRWPDREAVWTGEEMLVWGGYGPTGETGGGGRYDPAADAWTPIAEAGAPQARWGHVLVWTGEEMLVWAGAEYSPEVLLASGGGYDPDTDSWRSLDTAAAPLPTFRSTAIWSGTEMIVWGGECDDTTVPTCHGSSYEGGRYDPVADAWTPTALDGVPEARSSHTAVWTGDAMIVWGGTGAWNGYRHTGGVYRPAPAVSEPPIFVNGFEAVEQGRLALCTDCS